MDDRSENRSAIAHTLPLLDWLRFGAALMVVIKHCKDMSFPAFTALPLSIQAQLATKTLYALTRYGDEAVLVFFVLSGYLVGGSSFNRLRQGTFYFWTYAVDRISRILVPLLPTILFTAAVQAWQGTPASPVEVLGSMLSVQGVLTSELRFNPSLWTLTYEVWFYLLNGAVIAMVANKSRFLAPTILFMSLALFSTLKLDFLICWYLGVISYFWVARGPNPVSAFAAVLLVCFATAFVELAGQPRLSQYTVLAHFMLGFSIVLLVRQLAAIRSVDSKLMQLGASLSDFSYSLYLIHYPILFLIARWIPKAAALNGLSIIHFLFRITVSLVGGYIFYLMFERHTRTVRRFMRNLGVKRKIGDQEFRVCPKH